MLEFFEHILDFIKDLFNIDVDPEAAEGIAETTSDVDAGDIADAMAVDDLANVNSESVNNVLKNGIQFQDAPSDDVTDTEVNDNTEPTDSNDTDNSDGSTKKRGRHIPFVGATKCNLCSCRQYVGKTGIGNKCVCGHDYVDHEWVD